MNIRLVKIKKCYYIVTSFSLFCMVIITTLVMMITGYKYSYITSEFYHYIKCPILLVPRVNNVLVGNTKWSFFSPNFEAFLNLETFTDYHSIVNLYLNFVTPIQWAIFHCLVDHLFTQSEHTRIWLQ